MPADAAASRAMHRTYSFGEFCLDRDRGALVRAGREIWLRPKSFDVLLYLLERQGYLVTKDELLDAVWGDVCVAPDAVAHCILEIRKTLDDQNREIIRTVPRRGYVFEVPVTAHGDPDTETSVTSQGDPVSKRPRWPLAAALALMLGIAIGWLGFEDRGTEVPDTNSAYTVAVLPFVDMSPEQDKAYMSDGISEEILHLLARITGLRVIARSSSFSFKGSALDIATIAEELGATHVLEGSVRSSGDRVRITAQLVDGATSEHLWSMTFDRDLSAADLFHVQSDIAREVIRELQVTLTDADKQQLAKVPTRNTEAYSAYLLGRKWLADRKVEELRKAAEQFATAIELDSEFAAAYSGLADACYLFEQYSGGHTHKNCPAPDSAGVVSYRALTLPLARKAIELDENLGEAWISLGSALEGEADSPHELSRVGPSNTRIRNKLKEARAAYERGLSLNPSHTQGYLWYAALLGRPDSYESWESWLEAWNAETWQSVIIRGLQTDPLSISLHYQMSEHRMWAHSDDEAFYHARRVIEIAPDSPRGYERLGELSWKPAGRIDESIRWNNRAADTDPLNPTYPARIAYGYAMLGDIDMALTYWERAATVFADGAAPDEFHILRAIILLSNKDGIPLQQVLDALEPASVHSIARMEIEAKLAVITGQAADWLSGHKELLAECLEAEIDTAYVDQWRGCGIWLDCLLHATGEEARARAATEMRMEWEGMWTEFWGRPGSIRSPQYFVILGEEDRALESFETYLGEWRGNPHRYYLEESLRFLLYHDPLFDTIRDHPRVQTVIAEIEADFKRQLENVREMERRGELPTLEEL